MRRLQLFIPCMQNTELLNQCPTVFSTRLIYSRKSGQWMISKAAEESTDWYPCNLKSESYWVIVCACCSKIGYT